MQWKIPPPRAFADRFNRWAIARGFPALAWLAPRAPRWFLFANARWIIALVFFFHASPKRVIARNLARVLDAPVASRRVRRAVGAMLRHFAFYWVDLFRFAQLPAARLRALIVDPRLADLAPLEEARIAGQRQILMTAHLGNWELGAVLAGQANLPLSVIYVPDAFEHAEAFRSQLRGLGNVREIPLALDQSFSGLPILRAFSEGRILALQGDRDFRDDGVEVELFGAPARLPAGPFLLARMSGARLIPTFIAYARDYRFEVEFGEAIEVGRTEDREGDVRAAVERWREVLERAIRRWPTQWYTFYDFWPTGHGGEAA